MSLINPAILFGLVLAIVPVILHFMLRAKPKKLLFPALRLIENRRRQSVRRLRLRHLWLLLLRIAVIVLLVLAIARPSLPAADYLPTLREWLTLAAVVAAGLACYWGLMRYWRRHVPVPQLRRRRTTLQGGLVVAALVLLLLLVAWPYQRRISGEISGPAPRAAADIPVAAVLLFDTSLSMQYQHENRTRVEVARSIAAEHLAQLPAQSRAAVAGSGGDVPLTFAADLSAARTRMESLAPQADARPLNERLRAALELHQSDRRALLEEQRSVPEEDRRDRYIREVFIFTDLAQSAWARDPTGFLRAELERLDWANLYIIDVGVTDPVNRAVTSLQLGRQSVTAGGQARVEAAVELIGVDDRSQTVELYLPNDSGRMVKEAQATLDVAAGSASRVPFQIGQFTGDLRQGEVRLASSDPLPFDDVRYFSIAVQPPQDILLVADRPQDTELVAEALAAVGYRTTVASPARLPGDLSRFDAVCLLSIQSPPEPLWQSLATYTEAGGGVAVVLGTSQLDAFLYNSEAARDLLPAPLDAYSSWQDPPVLLDLQNVDHPVFRTLEDLGGTSTLTSLAVRRFWRTGVPHADATPLARFTDEERAVALFERPVGRGRVTLFTTALEGSDWNDLALGEWTYVALLDQWMQYLSYQSDGQYNFLAGDPVELRVAPADQPRTYLLSKPQFQQLPGGVAAGAGSIAVDAVDQVGSYRLVGTGDATDLVSGFSVNPRPDESDLTRLESDELDAKFGKGRYSMARDVESLEMAVGHRQIGQEIYSLVLACVVAAFCAEHLVANRFYRVES